MRSSQHLKHRAPIFDTSPMASSSSRVRWAVAVLPLLLAARIYAPTENLRELAYLLVPGWSLALLLGRWLRGEPSSTAWGIFTVGFGTLFAAELYWFAEDVFELETFPGPGEYLEAVSFVILTFGLWRTTLRVAPIGDRTGIIDSTAVALAAATLGWLFVVEPAARSTEMEVAKQAELVIQLGLDVVLLAVLTRLGFSLRVRPPAYLFLYLGAGGLVALDGGESMIETGGGTEFGRLGDLLMMAAYGCWGLAAISPDRLARTSASALRYVGVRRVLVLGASVLVPLIASAVQHLRGVPQTGTAALVLGGLGIAIVALVMVRIAGLFTSVRHLADERGRERFAALVEHSSDGILMIDRELRVSYASPALFSVWGHRPSDLVGHSVTTLFAARDAEVARSQLERSAALPTGATLDFESTIRRADGAERQCQAIAANLIGHAAIGERVLTLRDITDRKRLEAELTEQAFHDSLTGLANRALFLDRVEHSLRVRSAGSSLAYRLATHSACGDRPAGDLAVVFLDLDDFKQVNDGLGHAAGDELLGVVGARLLACVQSGDTVARLGGDEFAILFENRSGVSEVLEATERILALFTAPLRAGGLELAVRGSAGVALAGISDTAHDLIQHADIAMYEAKAAGRGSYQVFDPAMKRAAAERIALRADLDRAIEEQQLTLVYQPIVELRSGRIKGAEALLRWQHPTRGLVSPADFIPIAEQSGRIAEIGQWVLERACHDAAGWQRGGAPVTINVNVSAVQLRDASLPDRIVSALADARLAPDLLIVEITETAMMNDPDATAAILEKLRALGVRIALDDFGTGYCSLAYLTRFAVDYLKIDRAFVSEVKADSEHLLAHNILHMAECLGMAAVAEGIEEAAQLENLRSNGCAYGQGYHLGRPMDPSAFATRLGIHASG